MVSLVWLGICVHALLSAFANFDRGGDRDLITPEEWPERQITGLVYYLPFLLLGVLALDWRIGVYMYLLPALLTIAVQAPGRGSYGDAATVKRPDNESLRHVLNLIPALREQPSTVPGEIIPNAKRDFTGLAILGTFLALPGCVAAGWMGYWLSIPPILIGGMSMPIWYFFNNNWYPESRGFKPGGHHISLAELLHGLVIGLGVSSSAVIAYAVYIRGT